ncbi:MAG: tRNA (adenosine(37)-N6)-threonylcarbamoyltransferase complex transferase subunit TsaD [Dehalococcoidia bacterium]
MRILGIESSCDETAAAVVADGRRMLSNVVASQTALHQETGGVVPEVAARAHLRALVPVVRRALADAECSWDDIDAIAATAGPGLPGALVIGLNGARGLAYARGLPLIPVDHIEGHVCANWLLDAEPQLPALALVVSGGHTELLLMHEHGRFVRLGGTRDDAAGEAFDKVARLLGLPYPGGPPISRLAAEATVRRVRLPRAWLGESDDFSFSGLKTAVLHMVQSPGAPPPAEIAWAFEESVVDVLSKKAARAAEREGVASMLVAGGVAANRRLRERVIERSPVPVHIPPPVLCTDNAAMIAAAAFRHLDAAVAPESALDIVPTAVRRGRRWA